MFSFLLLPRFHSYSFLIIKEHSYTSGDVMGMWLLQVSLSRLQLHSFCKVLHLILFLQSFVTVNLTSSSPIVYLCCVLSTVNTMIGDVRVFSQLQ